MAVTKYHLGCGRKYMKGYCNVDYPPSKHNVITPIADVYADLLEMKWEEGKAEVIRSHHVFEHFGYVDSLVLLVRWTMALKVGGVLIVDVPNVFCITREMYKGSIEKDFAIMRLLYGDQGSPWAYHINGWTGRTLAHALGLLGYTVNIKNYGNNKLEFPNCGVKVRAEKAGEFADKEILMHAARKILRMYTKQPSERKLYEVLCAQFESKV